MLKQGEGVEPCPITAMVTSRDLPRRRDRESPPSHVVMYTIYAEYCLYILSTLTVTGSGDGTLIGRRALLRWNSRLPAAEM